MAKKEKIDPNMDLLNNPGGKLPSKDKKTFSELVAKISEAWDITRPQELMLVNRLVSTWMKMQRVETLLSKYDLFYERRDKNDELIGVNMNQLAYYLKSLEADFRNYYKVLESKFTKINDSGDGPKDFHEFLNAESEEIDENDSGPEEDKE